jgi:hypothetical protein
VQIDLRVGLNLAPPAGGDSGAFGPSVQGGRPPPLSPPLCCTPVSRAHRTCPRSSRFPHRTDARISGCWRIALVGHAADRASETSGLLSRDVGTKRPSGENATDVAPSQRAMPPHSSAQRPSPARSSPPASTQRPQGERATAVAPQSWSMWSSLPSSASSSRTESSSQLVRTWRSSAETARARNSAPCFMSWAASSPVSTRQIRAQVVPCATRYPPPGENAA